MRQGKKTIGSSIRLWLIREIAKHLFTAIDLTVSVSVQDQPCVITAGRGPCYRLDRCPVSTHVKVNTGIRIR